MIKVLIQVIAVIIIMILTMNYGFVIVRGDSMLPGCKNNDIILIDRKKFKIDYGVYVIKSAELGKNIIKRVIGLPNDRLKFVDGKLHRNGNPIKEDYVLGDFYCASEYSIPSGTVFVAGDNRQNSVDSRFMEEPYIPVDQVTGKYVINLSKFIREVFE